MCGGKTFMITQSFAKIKRLPDYRSDQAWFLRRLDQTFDLWKTLRYQAPARKQKPDEAQ